MGVSSLCYHTLSPISQWNLTFDLRQRSAGHVISVRSVSGECVRVNVAEDGRLMMVVSSESGSETVFSSVPLPHNIFTAVVCVDPPPPSPSPSTSSLPPPTDCQV